MKPATPFAKSDQQRMRSLTWEPVGTATPGRVIFCKGRSVLGYGDVEKLGDFLAIPKQADTVCVATADFDDIKRWMG